jgi:hypothetical protein
MSSDNYNLVREQKDGTWWAWRNLDASSDVVPEKPERVFSSFEAAFFYADEKYAEYGTTVTRIAPPNEGSGSAHE